MKLHNAMLTGLFLISILAACKNESNKETKPDVVAQNIDSTVAPGEDFFQYANGTWIKNNPIPDDRSSTGIWYLVIEENMKRLKKIAEEAAAAHAAKGTSSQKIGDFWTIAMDSAKLEKDGLKPIEPWLQKIDAIKDVPSLLATSIELRKIGSGTLFSSYVTQDDKNSDVMSYKLSQGGIGLPEREYYFKTDSATVNIRNQYVNYIAKMLAYTGEDSAAAMSAAKNILALETKMAKASRKLEDLRDPNRNYNKMAITDLGKMNKTINWADYLKAVGVKDIDSVIVGQPEFFKALDQILISVPIADWKNYVKFNFVADFSNALPEKFGNAAFEFGKLFSGAKVRQDRWKRAIQSTESAMGELLGQLYVKEYFNEKTKERYSQLVENIKDAMKTRIAALTWMSDSTKQKAFAKLAAMKKKVGYPDKWKDFIQMEIGKDSYFQNLVNANSWWYNYNINKLGKPVDRDEWDMYPQTYNAYYSTSNNEIVLPAGIFTVPGYKDEELDDAVVYGYAGASTIGHEITHGFDDQGRQYDAQGNLKNWWTKNDEDEFTKRADVMIKQFDEFEPVKGYHINGKATLGENIADLGGILLGIEAFKKTDEYKENKIIGGLTPMQRFFCGYAIGWLGHTREESLRSRLLTDVHSPAKYRVNGPFADVDEFYKTFNVQPGDKMYRPDSLRVRIW
ncbi:MAG: M13 family metallopeptidase [Chitinophagaceae bacterium]